MCIVVSSAWLGFSHYLSDVFFVGASDPSARDVVMVQIFRHTLEQCLVWDYSFWVFKTPF